MGILRILIADDHVVVRQGVRNIIESQSGWKVVAEAQNGLDAVRQARETRPDIALLDYSMPQMNGLEATEEILKVLPGTQVLILTMHDSDQLVREVLAAGARGYVLKADAGDDIVNAIQALSEHRPFFTAKVTEMLLDRYRRKSSPAAGAVTFADELTPRERQVLKMLAEGKSSKEIAVALDISTYTADSHRARIMRKLKLHTLAELVRYAIRNEMIEP